MPDTESQPNPAPVENPQENLRDRIIKNLSARPDIDEIITDARIKLTQPAPAKPAGRGISRRTFVIGLAAAAVAGTTGGFIAGRTTANPDSASPAFSLPEAKSEEVASFNELIRPLIEEAHRRRRLNPEGIDWGLNRNRLNFGLSSFAQGQGESLTVITYDEVSGILTNVITTRETLLPEVIRHSRKKHPDMKFTYQMEASTAQHIYRTWGFDLMRRVTQNETGLAADFQFYHTDMALHDFIAEVLGNSITIKLKERLHLRDFDFDKRWKARPDDPDDFVLEAGDHVMTAREAMRFILSDAPDEFVPGVAYQVPGRKNDILKAGLHRLGELFKQNPVETGKKLTWFLQQRIRSGEIATDYDFFGGGINLTALMAKLATTWLGGRSISFPEVGGDGIQINDELFGDSHGDSGTIRVNRLIDLVKHTPNENYYKYAHPSVQRLVDKTIKLLADIEAEGVPMGDPERGQAARLAKVEVLPPWMQIPILGDIDAPDAELAEKYYRGSRKLVKEKLAG